MKSAHLLVIGSLLAAAANIYASDNYVPQRSDYSFTTRVTQTCDDDDPEWCHADSIITYLTDARQHTDTLLTWPQSLDTTIWQGIGDILEIDINFDDIPDLLVCEGPTNSFGNWTYDAFVWDQSTHQFVRVPGFNEIFSPEPDPAKRQINGTWRLDNDLEFSTYEWQDGHLILVNSEQAKYDEMF